MAHSFTVPSTPTVATRRPSQRRRGLPGLDVVPFIVPSPPAGSVIADNFATGTRAQRLPGHGVDGVLDQPHGPVPQQGADARGVPAAGVLDVVQDVVGDAPGGGLAG